MKTHKLKTDPAAFQAVFDGQKTHEIRRDDRGFSKGDQVHLLETRYTGAEMAAGAALLYTGREIVRGVTHVLRGPIYGLEDGWSILSLSPSAPSSGGKKGDMAYFTPRPGRYMSGYVFTTTRISGSRINGEIRVASSGEFLGSFGFEIDDVLEIHHPQGYGFDTDEPYVPGGQDE